MALLTAKLAAVDAVAILNRCTETAHVLQNPTETRSLGELQADVLRDLMINGTIPDDSPARTTTHGTDDADDSNDDGDDGDDGGAGGQVLAGGAATGIRATVLIMVPATTLLGRSDEPAILEGYGPIDLETATELAAGASSWIRVLTHPETGVIMSVGHTRYRVPAAMRLWLRIRDLICRFPGCNRKAKYCDLDHIIEWQYGGHTSTDNLHNLCPGHHNVKGYTGWSVRYLADGFIEWVSPAGRTHTTEPAIPLQFTTTGTDPATTGDTIDNTDDTDDTDSDSDSDTATPTTPIMSHDSTTVWDATTNDPGWYIPPTNDPTPF
jgi:hypothetical protein